MNRGEIRAAARRDLDDAAEPYLWSDAFLNAAIDEAIDQAARRARLITDSATAEICTIATTNGNALYDLDDRIIAVRRVMSSLRSTPVQKIRLRDLDAQYPGWQAYDGDVSHWCPDFQTGKLLVVRKPNVSYLPVLTLTVVRTTLAALTSDNNDATGTPEIAPRYHHALRHWVVFTAYMKPDEDTYRPDKAKAALTLFEREFGKDSSAQDERWIHENHGYDQEEGLY